ncbi:MAG: NYN domain-containing protein [Planctomycetaceae bacterium]
MSPGDLLIDGYNVLHAAGLARRSYGPGEFEKRRANLIRMIAQQLSARERRRTTIVFDASDRSVLPSPPKEVYDVLVLFADEGGDADATIERLIQENSAPRRLCVISSDHRLQKAARRRRAKFLDSDVFLQRLANRSHREHRHRQQDEPDTKRSGHLPPAEVEAWLRVFDDIDQVKTSTPSEASRSSKSVQHQTASKPSPEAKPLVSPGDSPHQHEVREHLSREVEFWESRISELWDDS